MRYMKFWNNISSVCFDKHTTVAFHKFRKTFFIVVVVRNNNIIYIVLHQRFLVQQLDFIEIFFFSIVTIYFDVILLETEILCKFI